MGIATAIVLLVGVSCPVAPSHAAKFTVTSAADQGPGSLRNLILHSNRNGKADTIVFASNLTGQTLQPITPLPPLAEGNLTIDGDNDQDGKPEITIDGTTCGGTGFDVRSQSNKIRNLAIGHFSKAIAVSGASGKLNVVSGCRLGTDLAGTLAAANEYGVYVSGGAGSNTVGGVTSALRNLISGNTVAGVVVSGGAHNAVLGNYLGVNLVGSAALATAGGVIVQDGALGPRIGNSTAGSGNVISGNQQQGLIITGTGTRNTQVLQNLIGTTPDGKSDITNGGDAIDVVGSAGSFAIGAPGQGNAICVWGHTTGILVSSPNTGASPIVDNDLTLPFQHSPYQSNYGIRISLLYGGGFTGRIADNFLFDHQEGLACEGAGVHPVVAGNKFQWCRDGITIWTDAFPNLGNLGDKSTSNDGGNQFVQGSGVAVGNHSTKGIKAEGNNWGTTSKTQIEAMIYDGRQHPGCGIVDYDPLIGGVHPTGGGLVHVSGVVAESTNAGVEVVLTLSAPAEVTVAVLNAAGRTVAALAPQSLPAGLNRLSWGGLSTSGTRVPAGHYLVRVTARGTGGGQASSLASLRLVR